MDFLTILKYVLAVLETVFLVGSLVCAAKAIHEKKIKHKSQEQKGSKSSEIIEKTVAMYYRNACIFFLFYLILNLFRRYGGIY